MSGELIADMPRAQYDTLERVNWSRLKEMARSPAHYRWALEHPPEDSDAKKVGRALHLAILEPERFASECVVWTGGRRAGKAWDEFSALHEGKEILTADEAERIEGMRRAVLASPAAAQLVSGGRAEVTMLWDTEVVPGVVVPCRGRLDYERPDALVDLKVTRDASPEGFGRHAWVMRYHAQAAFYVDGYAAITGRTLPFVFVAVENVAPYVVQTYVMTPEAMAAGRDEYMRLLAQLETCRITGEWPGYATGPMPLTLPRWAALSINHAEEDLEHVE